MKLAFFISAYKLDRQFAWLFESIWNEHDIFAIHLDANCSDEFVSKIRHTIGDRTNVHVLPRMQLAWGGWSLVEMNLAAIRYLCRRPERWSYFINLSGQDYPIRPLAEFRSHLTRHDGRNFIQLKHIDTQPSHIRRRLHWYCIEHRGRLRRLPIPNLRSWLSSVEWYGDLWCNLNRSFCDWLDRSDVVDDFRSTLRHTKIPDEFFFQSIVMQSPFSGTVDCDHGRFLQFVPNSGNPKVLTSGDLERMLGSEAFFARKFDESVDGEVLRRLADRIGAPAPQ